MGSSTKLFIDLETKSGEIPEIEAFAEIKEIVNDFVEDSYNTFNIQDKEKGRMRMALMSSKINSFNADFRKLEGLPTYTHLTFDFNVFTSPEEQGGYPKREMKALEDCKEVDYQSRFAHIITKMNNDAKQTLKEAEIELDTEKSNFITVSIDSVDPVSNKLFKEIGEKFQSKYKNNVIFVPNDCGDPEDIYLIKSQIQPSNDDIKNIVDKKKSNKPKIK